MDSLYYVIMVAAINYPSALYCHCSGISRKILFYRPISQIIVISTKINGTGYSGNSIREVLYKGILHFVLLAKLINFKEQLIRA